MNILYITNLRFPTEKAYGIQIAKMCDAFSRIGAKTTLAVPELQEGEGMPDQDYDLRSELEIHRIPVWGLRTSPKVQFILRTAVFFLNIFRADIWREADVIYVRDKLLAFLLSFTSKSYVWEIHQDYDDWKTKRALKCARGVVVISEALKEFYLGEFDVTAEGVFVAPDAVGEERFEDYGTKSECREKLGLPQDKKIVLYSGHLYPWKGVDTLAQAADYIENADIQITFLGGTEKDIQRFRDTYGSNDKVAILGRKPYAQMPYYKEAADILVIPNTAETSLSESFSSPMKLFSSMASGKPTIATRVRSVYGIADESMMYFCRPDDPEDMARAIHEVVMNYDEALERGSRARDEAWNKYTWKKRAGAIIDFIKSSNKEMHGGV